MDIREYLDTLTSQIRSKKARLEVAREIESHIKEQAQDYMDAGMSRKEAVLEAVRQMGNPVEVGIDMDRIHRPKNNWPVLGMVAVMSLIGLLVQYFCIYRFGTEGLPERMVNDAFLRQCVYTLAGLGFMMFLYFCDYSLFGKYGKVIGTLFLGSVILACNFILPVYNGGYSYIKTIMYLFIPIYGGILYGYHGKGYTGAAYSFLWLLAGAYTSFVSIGGGLGITLDVMFTCALMLIVSLFKNWYQVKKKLIPLLSLLVLAMTGGSCFYMGMQPYQMARIRAVLNPWAYAKEGAFQIMLARDIIKQLKLLGGLPGNGALNHTPAGLLPGAQYNYVILQAASTWGILAACALAGLLLLFLICLFFMVKKQKNQLGQLIGYGCVMILSLETLWNLLINLGLIMTSTAGLPFFTYGKCHTIAVYGLFGILLSIYRYKDLIWERHVMDKRSEKGVLAHVGKYRIRIDRIDT